MLRTYEAVIHDDRLKWLHEKPKRVNSHKDLYVHVTILDKLRPEKNTPPKKGLVEFFRDSPLLDSGLEFGRDEDSG